MESGVQDTAADVAAQYDEIFGAYALLAHGRQLEILCSTIGLGEHPRESQEEVGSRRKRSGLDPETDEHCLTPTVRERKKAARRAVCEATKAERERKKLERKDACEAAKAERERKKAERNAARESLKAAREAAKEEKEQRKAAAKTRSHEQLRALDALVALGLSYPGWEADVEEAERYHVECPSLFDQFLAQMTKRQSMQQGDRSHEQLRALDALVASGLTYPGWEADVKEAETTHVEYPSLFEQFLAEMQKKQALQQGCRSHEQLRALDALVASGLSYPGWEADVKEAETTHVNYPTSFDRFLSGMQKKQALQQGDRSHEQLRALDALVASGLTYPGWEADMKEAETTHVNYPTSFDRFLAEMQKKQSKQPGGSSKIRQEKRKASAQKRRRVTPSSPSREKPQTC